MARSNKKMNFVKGQKLVLVMVVALLVAGILACDIDGRGGAARPTVNVTAPTSGARFRVGQEVNVLVTASDPKGVKKVELAVDGLLYRTDSSSSLEGDLTLIVVQTWVATDPGMHTLTVTAINVDGLASEPWAITVEVVGEGEVTPSPALPTATPSAGTPSPPPPTNTPIPPTPTATAVPPQAPEITYFRANGSDGPITVAPGTAVTLSWEWERVNEGYLDPGNIPMACPAMPCTYEVSPTATTTYTLRAVNSAGTDEEAVTVEVARPLADLVVDELTITPPNPEWGGSVHVRVGIYNAGEGAAGPFKVLWRYGSEDFDVCEWNMPSLDPGDGGILECDVEHVYTSFTTVANVDWRGEVEESNEANNSRSSPMNVGPPPALPDLSITELTVTPPNPASGDAIHVRVRVVNRGDAPAGPHSVLWRWGENDLDVWEWSVESTNAGAGWLLEYDLPAFYESYNTVTTVDWRNEVVESNEDNNSRELRVNVR
jgi:hypothetical protein